METLNTNTVQILKNYLRFAKGARYRTAQLYLKEFETSDHLPTQKLMMVRIVVELIASTEDLAMWLVAIHERNKKNPSSKDIFVRVLNVFIRENGNKPKKKANLKEVKKPDPSEILQSFERIKTARGLLRKL